MTMFNMFETFEVDVLDETKYINPSDIEGTGAESNGDHFYEVGDI